jgi:hypothetical protein
VKGPLWLLLFVVALIGLALPLSYLYVSSQLPRLESPRDVELLLRLNVEGERMSLRQGTSEKPVVYKYVHPEFSQLPKDLVALYLSQRGCPTYFQTPKEEGARWGWRMLAGLFLGLELEGNGFCERLFAMRLAEEAGAATSLQKAVATHKIHAALQKDELIAYHLSALYFDRGVVGVDDASRVLFKRELASLNLPELAEFILALPPHGFYDDIRICKNASLIQRSRDMLLVLLARDGLVSEQRAREAEAMPVKCRDP